MPRLHALLLVFITACAGAGDGDVLSDDVLLVEPDGLSEAKADGAAGRTELKVSIRADQVSRARRVFGLAEDKAERREVWFYDDAGLSLFDEGLILRARKVLGGDDDSTVKVRPLAAADVAARWFGLDGFKCEEERTGARSVESCSLTTVQERGEIDDVAAGGREVVKLFSKDQEAFAADHGPAHLPWSDLRPLGPIEAQAWKVTVKGFETRLAAEQWRLPGGEALLEVSIRVPRADADRLAGSLERLLSDKGLDTSVPQETKTRRALEFLSTLGE